MADEFRINEAYAEKYNKWREKEELQKLKDKYGDVDEDELDSSSSEDEDEDAEALTPQLEKDWLRTLSAIKSKDPRIYKKDYTFFEEKGKASDADDKKEIKKKAKPMFLKDYERKVILEKDGKITDSSDEDDEDEAEKPPGYYEEQEEIKESFKAAVDSDSDMEENFLTKRKKSKEEQEKEEEEYIEWLKGNKDALSNDKKAGVELDPLKNYWTDPKLAEKDKFLRDYILNKQYLDDDEERIPTYDEIVEENISEEEDVIEKQEEFERKYNFRYEEPDPEFIKSYPRTIGDSVRRKKEKRAEKRKEAKERKKKDKDKKKEEIKKLKNLKKNEILNKLDHLKEVTGNETIGFTNDDIEGDFDPKQHDDIMKKVFSEGYYDDLEGDVTKPVFSDDEELGLADENWDEWTGPTEGEENYVGGDGEYYEEPHCEDPNFNMDADFDPTQDRSFGLDGRSKKKKKSKFKQAVEKKKPVFDPNEKTFEEYFDEYYKLDYEDIIGDLPCRFKYRQTEANDFGLSAEEVLGCKDKELNTWVSVKKMSQYRTSEEEAFDARIYKKKARNVKHKLQILSSLQEPEEEKVSEVKPSTSGIAAEEVRKQNEVEEKPNENGDNVKGASQSAKNENKSNSEKTKPKLVNKSKKRKISESEKDGLLTKKPKQSSGNSLSQNKQADRGKVKSFKKKKKVNNKTASSIMSDERLKAYGIDPKKFKYTHGKKSKQT